MERFEHAISSLEVSLEDSERIVGVLSMKNLDNNQALMKKHLEEEVIPDYIDAIRKLRNHSLTDRM